MSDFEDYDNFLGYDGRFDNLFNLQYRNNESRYLLAPIDLEGKPIKRTKQSHPYTYDGHVIGRLRKNEKRMECAYTDRMYGWDHDKMVRLTKKYIGNYRWTHALRPLSKNF